MPRDTDETLRPLYAEETRELCRRGTENACLLAVALVPAFAILDAVLFPSEILFFVGLRLISGTALAVALWLLNRPWAHATRTPWPSRRCSCWRRCST